ncbi:hypothetical protein H8356DRAFT_1361392 [Neocallimastix lanati (nom. inval.)]|nr:hypothetical protein H8356DRAFT_1361392 [Neocallimastix sp. JGI-2020a]
MNINDGNDKYLTNYNINNCPHELNETHEKSNNQKLLNMIKNNHLIYKVYDNPQTRPFFFFTK